MRISSLHISLYGPFRDFDLKGLDADLVLFHGPNEAGKSSLLNFIRVMLFGFPRPNTRQGRLLIPRGPHLPSGGQGELGGRLELMLDSDGRRISIERYRGLRSSSTAICDQDGAEISQAQWEALLGGVSRQLYLSVFAFGLDELKGLDAMEKEKGLGEVLFGAGMGLGFKRLPEARAYFSKIAEEIFTPGARKKRMNLISRELKALRSEIRKARGGLALYESHTSKLSEIRRKRSALSAERSELAARLSRLQVIRDSWGLWEELMEIRSELSASNLSQGEPTLEDADYRRACLLKERLDSARGAADEQEARIAHMEQLLQGLEEGYLGPDFIEEAEKILAERPSYLDARRRMEKLLGEKKAVSSRLSALYRELGVADQAGIPRFLSGNALDFSFNQTLSALLEELDGIKRARAGLKAVESKLLGELEDRVRELSRLERQVADRAESASFDPEPLNELSNRLASIYGLKSQAEEKLRELFDAKKRLDEFLLRRRELGRFGTKGLEPLDEALSTRAEGLAGSFDQLSSRLEEKRGHDAGLERRISRLEKEISSLRERAQDIMALHPALGPESALKEIERAAGCLRKEEAALKGLKAEKEATKQALFQLDEEIRAQEERLARLSKQKRLLGAWSGGIALLFAGFFIYLFLSPKAGHFLFDDKLFGMAMGLLAALFLAAGSWMKMRLSSDIEGERGILDRKRKTREELSLSVADMEQEISRREKGLMERKKGLASRLSIPEGSDTEAFEEALGTLREEQMKLGAIRGALDIKEEERRGLLEEKRLLEEEISRELLAIDGLREEYRKLLLRIFEEVAGRDGPGGGGGDTGHRPDRDRDMGGAFDIERFHHLRQGCRQGLQLLEDLKVRAGELKRILERARQVAGSFGAGEPGAGGLKGDTDTLIEGGGLDGPDLSDSTAGLVDGFFSGLISGLEGEIARLEAERQRFEKDRAVIQKISDKQEEISSIKEALGRIEGELSGLEARKGRLLVRWRAWLSDLGLPAPVRESLSMEGARDYFQQAQEAMGLVERLSVLDEEIAAERRISEEIMERLSAFLSSNGIEAGGEGARAFSILEKLLDRQKGLREEIGRARAKMAAATDELGRLRARQEEAEAGLKEMLDRAGAASFRQLKEIFDEVTRLRHLSHRAAMLEEKLSGRVGISPSELEETFGGLSLSELEEQISRIVKELDSKDGAYSALENEAAEVLAELKQLEGEEGLLALQARQQALVQEMNRLARQWARARIGLHLMECARRRFEEEQQPRIMQEASRIFRLMTNENWDGVIRPAEGPHLLARTKEGILVEPSLLSRGTVEQLYLAMRLGYLLGGETGSEALPVIFDDILVNFDPERARAAAKAICRVAGKRQLLFFSCHPGGIELMKEAARREQGGGIRIEEVRL